jgi:hypothetical protein
LRRGTRRRFQLWYDGKLFYGPVKQQTLLPHASEPAPLALRMGLALSRRW